LSIDDDVLLINASNIKVGGGLQVAISVVSSLLLNDRGKDIYFAVSQRVYEQLYIPEILYNRVFIVDLNIKSVTASFEALRSLDKLVVDYKITKVFSLFGPTYWNPKEICHLIGFANAWLVSPEKKTYKVFSNVQSIKMKIKNYILGYLLYKKRNHYVTETCDMKNKFIDYFNHNENKIHVVSNCLSPLFINNNSTKFDFLNNIKKTKFITISHNYPHKNLSVIEKVAQELNSRGLECIFVVTFSHDEYEKQTELFKKHTINIGTLTIADCANAYSSCDALFLPTLLECFTISYLEAMKINIPIFTSNLSFAKDLCGDCASYFDPFSIENIVETLEDYILEPESYDFHQRYIGHLAKFPSNESRVDSYLKIIEKMKNE
jgi:hypothetical protein